MAFPPDPHERPSRPAAKADADHPGAGPRSGPRARGANVPDVNDTGTGHPNLPANTPDALPNPDQIGEDDAPREGGAAPVSRDVIEGFVEAWGHMGSVWGISRTMAEVHALLYITGEAMCTDEVMSALQISRGNASMSLRALLDWGLVGRAHRRGDRKDYFKAEQDVWSIFRAIVRERMKREIDPLLVNLHELSDRTAGEREDAAGRARLDRMIEFLEMTSRLGDRFVGPSGPGLRLAATLLAKSAGGPDGHAGSGHKRRA